MALSSGTRLGRYEIAGEIGAGGMGVVYRARDTKLDRDVAIKVLPESMASDAERVARFDREAKTLASLNHPNIAQIHGLEESDGTTALVLELVEGPTLADRLEQGPLSADEAMAVAMQIAAALEAAHSQGIVHRDLKPANVKVRPDRTVKVLDFGIAKAMQPDVLTSAPQSPILTTPATQVGVILGTAAYMSPEQAKGQPIDQRSDIWAFGCLLYEMLTGQMAFGAEDVPTTLARVIDRETDLDSLSGTVSPPVRQTLQLCLQKDVGKRIADIRDVRLALEGAFGSGPAQSAEGVSPTLPLWRRAIPFASIGVLAIVVGFGAGNLRLESDNVPRRVERFDYDLPLDQFIRTFAGRNFLAVAADGSGFAYDTQGGLYLRSMADLEARVIPGTEPPMAAPAFAPDGQAVVFWDGAGLRRISINGGTAVVIAENVRNPAGMTWEADGTILFGQTPEGIYRVSASGGIPELIIPSEEGMVNYSPEILPGGESVLFTAGSETDPLEAQIVVQSLTTGERVVVIEGGSEAHYVTTGHLVYMIDDGLFAVAFDPESLTVSGGPVPLVEGIMRTGDGGFANYSIPDDGRLVYATGDVAVQARTLTWVDREGREESIDAPPRAYTSPRISPDGTKVALNLRDEDLDIWIWDLARQTLGRLTFDAGQDRFPVWSPDGLRIAYSSEREVSTGDFLTALDWRAADGTGSPERLVESSGQVFPHAFLPDGSGVLAQGDTSGANLNDDITLFPLNNESAAVPLLDSAFGEQFPAISPYGTWLAYASDESGEYEIYVRPFPDVDAGRWQVSTDGGVFPLWSRDGAELFFMNENALMAVTVETDPGFSAGNPHVLFEGAYLSDLGTGGRPFDVSLSGDRFLMIKPVQNTGTGAQIVVVQNWVEELKRLVPIE